MNNTVLLQSLALDLKRVAIGYHSGSHKMADRFLQEVLKRKTQLDFTSLSETIQRLTDKLDLLAKEQNLQKRADHALTYSTIFLSLVK